MKIILRLKDRTVFTQKQHISLKLSNKRPVSESCIGRLLARLTIVSDCLIRFKNTNSRTVALSIYWLLLSERLAEYQSSQRSVVSQEYLEGLWGLLISLPQKVNIG